MTMKNWKQTNIKTSPASSNVFENGKGKILWIRKTGYSNNQKWVLGGANRRGYMKNTYFTTKANALKSANQYMRKH